MSLWLSCLIPRGCCDFRHHVRSGREEEEKKRWPQTYWFNQKAKHFPETSQQATFYTSLAPAESHHYPRWRGRLGNQHLEEDEGYYVWLRSIASYCLGLGTRGNIIGVWDGYGGGCSGLSQAEGLCTTHAPSSGFLPKWPLCSWQRSEPLFSFGFLLRWSGNCFSALGLCTSLSTLSVTDRLSWVIPLSPFILRVEKNMISKVRAFFDFWSVILKSSHLSRF